MFYDTIRLLLNKISYSLKNQAIIQIKNYRISYILKIKKVPSKTRQLSITS